MCIACGNTVYCATVRCVLFSCTTRNRVRRSNSALLPSSCVIIVPLPYARYCKVYVGSRQVFRSTIVVQNLSPTWDETFVHHVPDDVRGVALDDLWMQFDLFDYDDFQFSDGTLTRQCVHVHACVCVSNMESDDDGCLSIVLRLEPVRIAACTR